MIVGAALTYVELHVPGTSAATVLKELSWQIPLGALILFLVGRLLKAPYMAYKEVQSEREVLEKGPAPTLESVSERIEKVNELMLQANRGALDLIHQAGENRANTDMQLVKQISELSQKTVLDMGAMKVDLMQSVVDVGEAKERDIERLLKRVETLEQHLSELTKLFTSLQDFVGGLQENVGRLTDLVDRLQEAEFERRREAVRGVDTGP